MELNIRKIFPAKKTESGTYPWITGGTFLADGRIMLADYNNPRLLVYDQDGTALNELNLCGKPRDLTVISENEAVATLPDEVLLQTINTELMILKKRIHLGYECYGISKYKDQLIVACGSHITFLNFEGDILKTVKVKGRETRYICSDSNGQIFYTTWNDDCVYSMDEYGNPLFCYKNINLKFCRGLAVNDEGNICVVGRWSHNVYKLSCDCNPLAVMMQKDDGLDFPTAIAFHNTDRHGKFLLSNNKGKSIMICDFSQIGDEAAEENTENNIKDETPDILAQVEENE